MNIRASTTTNSKFNINFIIVQPLLQTIWTILLEVFQAQEWGLCVSLWSVGRLKKRIAEFRKIFDSLVFSKQKFSKNYPDAKKTSKRVLRWCPGMSEVFLASGLFLLNFCFENTKESKTFRNSAIPFLSLPILQRDTHKPHSWSWKTSSKTVQIVIKAEQ